jgi:predicted TIM-barrel enzyme
MTDAGADIVVAHMGCTSGGTIGAKSVASIDSCVPRIQKIVDACKSKRPEVLVICHGGPLAMPADAQFVFERVKGVDGFYGASSMERLPTELALTQQSRDFVGLKLAHKP